MVANGSNSKKGSNSKSVKKTDLPTKDCVVCKRPFTWRKKWERCWEEVRYCSKRCAGMKGAANKAKNNRRGSD